MKEVDYQRYLLDGVKEMGGFGWKLSSMHDSGRLDLFLQVPRARNIILEVKMLEMPVNGTTRMKLPHTFTELQKRNMDGIGIAGAHRGSLTGWAGILPEKAGRVRVFAGVDHKDIPTKQEFMDQCFIREKGMPWSRAVEYIAETLDTGYVSTRISPALT